MARFGSCYCLRKHSPQQRKSAARSMPARSNADTPPENKERHRLAPAPPCLDAAINLDLSFRPKVSRTTQIGSLTQISQNLLSSVSALTCLTRRPCRCKPQLRINRRSTIYRREFRQCTPSFATPLAPLHQTNISEEIFACFQAGYATFDLPPYCHIWLQIRAYQDGAPNMPNSQITPVNWCGQFRICEPIQKLAQNDANGCRTGLSMHRHNIHGLLEFSATCSWCTFHMFETTITSELTAK